MHTEGLYNQWFLGNPAKIPVNGGKMPTKWGEIIIHRHSGVDCLIILGMWVADPLNNGQHDLVYDGIIYLYHINIQVI